MLLVQDICLSWGKGERTSACAEKRADFPTVFSLDKLPDTFHGDVIVHRLSFWQRGTTFQTLYMKDAYCFQSYASVQDLNLANLSIRLAAESYEVTFFYDERRRGRPVRQGQYGRVIWNERKTDFDTGEWYYQLHASNLLHFSGEMPKPDIFLTGRPDFEYKQMAALY